MGSHSERSTTNFTNEPNITHTPFTLCEASTILKLSFEGPTYTFWSTELSKSLVQGIVGKSPDWILKKSEDLPHLAMKGKLQVKVKKTY